MPRLAVDGKYKIHAKAMLTDSGQGVVLLIKVIPKAATHSVVGWENGYLKIRLAAVPEKGAANKALINFLSEILDISKSCITLLKGDTSRLKKIAITHSKAADIEKAICQALQKK